MRQSEAVPPSAMRMGGRGVGSRSIITGDLWQEWEIPSFEGMTRFGEGGADAFALQMLVARGPGSFAGAEELAIRESFPRKGESWARWGIPQTHGRSATLLR